MEEKVQERRLFIGLPVPDGTKKLLSELDPGSEKLRWASPSTYHITLCFIGETKMDPYEEVLPVMEEHCSRTPPFRMPFERLLTAPPKKPYMIWARFEAPEAFKQLHHSLMRSFVPEKARGKDPIPHITLARAKRGRGVSPEDIPKKPNLQDLWTDRVLLWESELRTEGAVHHQLGEAMLEG